MASLPGYSPLPNLFPPVCNCCLRSAFFRFPTFFNVFTFPYRRTAQKFSCFTTRLRAAVRPSTCRADVNLWLVVRIRFFKDKILLGPRSDAARSELCVEVLSLELPRQRLHTFIEDGVCAHLAGCSE